MTPVLDRVALATPSGSGDIAIRRLDDLPVLAVELIFPSASGELRVFRDGALVDRAELVGGAQTAGVSLAGVPLSATLTLSFCDTGGAPVIGIRIESIALRSDWGMAQRRHLKCYMPFTMAGVFSDFSVYPCCARQWLNEGQKAGNTKTERLSDMWNGEQFRKMRANFLAGNYSETCREDICPYLAGEFEAKADHPEVVRAVNEGQSVVDYGPLVLFHDVDRGCNLECIMCRDEKILIDTENVEQAISDIREAIDMGSLRQLWTSGAGEVLAMKPFVALLESDTLSRNDVVLSLTTNLTTLTAKLWDRISHNSVGCVVVSADGCSSATYDRIRVGGSWDMIEANMRVLSQMRKDGRIDNIAWYYTVMRQNVSDVAAAVRLSEELGFDRIRFMAQLGSLSRTEGNMFEDHDLATLDALYDQFESAGAFDNPRVTLAETAMRDRRYRDPEFLLSSAAHLLKRRGYSGQTGSPVPLADFDKYVRLVDVALDGIQRSKSPLSAHGHKLLEAMSRDGFGLAIPARKWPRWIGSHAERRRIRRRITDVLNRVEAPADAET